MPYKLSFVDDDTNAQPGSDPNHMTTARKQARVLAEASGRAIQIASEDKPGHLRPRIIIEPDGSGRRPAGTKAANEREDHKTEGACFCSACRAKRRERHLQRRTVTAMRKGLLDA